MSSGCGADDASMVCETLPVPSTCADAGMLSFTGAASYVVMENVSLPGAAVTDILQTRCSACRVQLLDADDKSTATVLEPVALVTFSVAPSVDGETNAGLRVDDVAFDVRAGTTMLTCTACVAGPALGSTGIERDPAPPPPPHADRTQAMQTMANNSLDAFMDASTPSRRPQSVQTTRHAA